MTGSERSTDGSGEGGVEVVKLEKGETTDRDRRLRTETVAKETKDKVQSKYEIGSSPSTRLNRRPLFFVQEWDLTIAVCCGQMMNAALLHDKQKLKSFWEQRISQHGEQMDEEENRRRRSTLCRSAGLH